MADRQVAALGQLESIQLAGQEGALLPRLPIGFSLTPAAIQGSAPAVGQHTRAILQEAGIEDAEIEDLFRSGVCEVSPA
jgi:formyl-CoA transferase